MICPAYAGVIQEAEDTIAGKWNLSRVCGDDPALESLRVIVSIFVPRMRG